MRAAVVVLLLAVLAAAAVDALGDRTQNRPDSLVPGSATRIVFDVDTYDAEQPLDQSARALWYACAQTVPNQIVSVDVTAGGMATAVVSPQLGEHGRKRIEGCLKDATIDRVRGDVLSIEDVPAARTD
jgi:hypothetical protein